MGGWVVANAVIVGGIRSPFVRAGDKLRFTPTQELGRMVTQELLFRYDVKPESVDELICGNVGTPPDATNVGRVISLLSGIPKDVIAHTISRNCASGMDSVTQAVEHVESGRFKKVIALGVESMSSAPLLFPKQMSEKLLATTKAKTTMQKVKAMANLRPGDFAPQIGLVMGLTDPVSGLIMGKTAEKIARRFGISREEQDEFAMHSHLKAVAAQEAGRHARETMTIYPQPKLEPISQDIGPRKGQSMESLGKMKPYFDPKYGTVTVANACMITDGACALLIMEEEQAKAEGYKPLGRIRSFAYAGCDPSTMGLGPVYATAKALDRAGMKLSDIQLAEINEAFAAQVIGCLRGFESKKFAEEELNRSDALGELSPEVLNVNGGAIALGHPVGATGNRITLTLLHEMERRNLQTGLATLCVGGGLGGAVIVERN
jgi:acetyl-CoA acetyltransferase family protein